MTVITVKSILDPSIETSLYYSPTLEAIVDAFIKWRKPNSISVLRKIRIDFPIIPENGAGGSVYS